MPSDKQVIALRLSEDVHTTLAAWAKRDGRSTANLISHILSTLVYRGEVKAERKRVEPGEVHRMLQGHRPPPAQIDISEAIADAVRKGPVARARATRKPK